MVEKTKEVIGEDNIVEYLEPSAGAGVFLDYLDKPYLAYDIEPEDERIVKHDYLKLDLEYKKGRCVIGNPPFGNRMNLVRKFYAKSINIADYIVYILPISQLDNNQRMYEFDLKYSEDLGVKVYSGRALHCCLNIYTRPTNNKLNKKTNYKLKDVDIVEYSRGRSEEVPSGYDFAMGNFGAGCVGKIPDTIGQYASECYFYINNKELKDQVLYVLKNYDWKKVSRSVANTYSLRLWRIYKVLKEQIPELE